MTELPCMVPRELAGGASRMLGVGELALDKNMEEVSAQGRTKALAAALADDLLAQLEVVDDLSSRTLNWPRTHR